MDGPAKAIPDAASSVSYLESPEFIHRVSVASSLSRALVLAATDPQVIRLAQSARRELLLERIDDLSSRAIEFRYESPYDVPLLGLLVAVWMKAGSTQAPFSRWAARRAREAPNTDWTGRAADDVLASIGVVERTLGLQNTSHEVLGQPYASRKVGPALAVSSLPVEDVFVAQLMRTVATVAFLSVAVAAGARTGQQVSAVSVGSPNHGSLAEAPTPTATIAGRFGGQ